MKASQYAVRVDEPETGRRLLYSTLYKTVIDLRGAADRWDAGDLSPVLALKTVADTFAVPDDTDEFAGAYHYLLHPPALPKTLYATVVVTMSCNLRCVYCHEMGRIAGKRMTLGTADEVAAFLAKRAEDARYQEVHLYYYGGEPLLNIEVMERISSALRNCLSIPVVVTLPTNAVLLDEAMGKRLASLGERVSLQFTLDGPREIHDRRRVGTKENYDRVLDAVASLPDSVAVTLRANVDTGNIVAVPDLLDDLIARRILPGRARWYAAPVAAVIDGSEQTNAPVYSATEWPEAAAFVWGEYTRRGLPPEGIEMGDGLCGVPNRSVVTIDCDGYLHPCTGLHSRSEASGHVRDGEVSWPTKMPHEFAKKCRECAYFPFCGGGCPATGCSSCAGDDPCPESSLKSLLKTFLRYRYGKA